MLGPPKVRDLDRPVLISLEAAVPQDHFYRHVISRLTVHQSFAAKAHHDCATNLHPSRAGVHS